jgi:hypothetical protein
VVKLRDGFNSRTPSHCVQQGLVMPDSHFSIFLD